MQGSAFLPSRDGFSFRNDFEYPASRVGRAAPLAQGYGLAGGMCLSALDRWLSGRPLPQMQTPPQPGDPLYDEFVRSQVALLGRGAWERILDWQSRPGMGRLAGPSGIGELTRGEWRRLRRSLDDGRPAVLCVLRTRGPFANPSENPIVLACRYEYQRETKRATVWLYDPNRPGNDDVRLTVAIGGRRRAPETTFIAERVRGFILLTHDHAAATPLRALEIGEQTSGGMAGRAAHLSGRGTRAAVRGRDGSLLVVTRADSRGDTDAPVLVKRIAVDTPLVSDPVSVRGVRDAVLARDANGSIVAFGRGLRGLRGRPLPSAKEPIRVDSGPAAVTSRGRLHVFGVRGGKLVHLVRSRAGGWSAADVATPASAGVGDPLEGTPAVCVAADHAVNVFVRTQKGRLAHMRLAGDAPWSATLLPAADGALAGDPVATIAPGDVQITVLCVTEDGELIQTRGGTDAWRVRNITRETSVDGKAHPLRVEIAVSEGSGSTLHVFGVSPRSGLVHYWCPPTLAWRAQNLTESRLDIGPAARVRGVPSVSRVANDQLIVAASGEKGIVVYRWSRSSDWTGDSLPATSALAESSCPAGPVVWADARGLTKLLAVLDDGRALLAVPGRPESAQRLRGVAPISDKERIDAAEAARAEAGSVAPSVGLVTSVDADSGVADQLESSVARTDEIAPSVAPAPDVELAANTLDLPTAIDQSSSEWAVSPLDSRAFAGLSNVDEPAGAVEGLDTGSFLAGSIELDAELPGFVEAGDPQTDTDGADPLAPELTGNAGLLDFGLHAMVDDEPPPTPKSVAGASLDGVGLGTPSDPDSDEEMSAEREDWGSYQHADPTVEPTGTTGGVHLGVLSFQPAAPLLPTGEAAPAEHLDIPDEPTLGLTSATADTAAVERARAAEKAAKLEAERIAAEKAAKKEAERIAAEKAARKEAERIAAEKAARREAERIAAEKAARKEAERIAAEKAARQEAERIAAEKAAKKEAERIAAQKETERIAGEDAARKEAHRIAAEEAARKEADRIAAEEAARKEADRIAAEEAARKEAGRIAAEKAAKKEADRTAAIKAQAAARKTPQKGKGADRKESRDAPAAAAETPRPERPLPAALEGLPLLDDKLRGPRVNDESDAAEAPKKPSPKGGGPKPKLRSVDDLLKVADEHEPTFDKKK